MLASLSQPAAGSGPEVMVYAAASLRDALRELAPACERAAGVRLLFNFGASNELARQIEAANKADVFFSADASWMDKVAEAGLVDGASRRAVLSNRLVVVGARGVSWTVASAADLARAPARLISLANPEAVPAGKYARGWLERQGQWEAVAPRVLPGVDVRAALAAVEAGAADLGIVYATDARASKAVRVVGVFPASSHPSIRYPVALLKASRSSDAAGFRAFLLSKQGRAIFARHGFSAP